MNSDHWLLIGGVNVGVIRDLELDWPHYLGKFQPGPRFNPYQELCQNICASHKEKRDDRFEAFLDQLFEIGVEIRTLENKVLFKRKGPPAPLDIMIIFISDTHISFRILSH